MPEIVVVQSPNSGGGNYIPERLKNVKIGDVLVFRSLADIASDYQGGNVRCGWNQEGLMDYLVTDKVEVEITSDIMERINSRCNYVVELPTESWNWQISLDMLQFKTVAVVAPVTVEKIDNLSIFVPEEKKKEDVIKAMKDQVDFKRFHQLLRLGSSNNCPKEKAEELLDIWAKSKYEFFILFGNKLSVEKTVELTATNDEMRVKIEDTLYTKFQKYVPMFLRLTAEEYVDNTVRGGDSELKRFMPDYYKRGSKLSGFFAETYNDKELNDALAGVLGNRKINAKVSISCDPYDYLTMSINNYSWKSCQKTGFGEWAAGVLALLLDEASLVSFKHNGLTSSYDLNNYKFEGNNKSWRAMLYVDKHNLSAIFSRHYPSFIDPMSTTVREMYEELASNHMGVENMWKLKKNTDKAGYVKGSNLPYHDVTDYGNQAYYRIQHKNADPSIVDKFVVGKDYKCLKCDNPVGRGTYFTCGRH